MENLIGAKVEILAQKWVEKREGYKDPLTASWIPTCPGYYEYLPSKVYGAFLGWAIFGGNAFIQTGAIIRKEDGHVITCSLESIRFV